MAHQSLILSKASPTIKLMLKPMYRLIHDIEETIFIKHNRGDRLLVV